MRYISKITKAKGYKNHAAQKKRWKFVSPKTTSQRKISCDMVNTVTVNDKIQCNIPSFSH